MYRHLLIPLLLLTACTHSAPPNQAVPGTDVASPAIPSPPAPEFASRYTHLPADAARVLARLDECRYFAGEFNGDGSTRDRQINARMTALGCAAMETEIAALRQTYAAHPAVTTALDALIENNVIEHLP